jgi:hypothetical protein
MARRTILAAILTMVGVALIGVAVWRQRPRLAPLEISQQTTYIIMPTRADGWVDYPEQVDWMRRANLDAGGTNAAGPLLRALGPGVLPRGSERARLLKQFGVADTATESSALVPLAVFAARERGQPDDAPATAEWLRARCGVGGNQAITQARILAWIAESDAPLANLQAASEAKALYVPTVRAPAARTFARLDPARLGDVALPLRCRAATKLLQGDFAASWRDTQALWRLGLLFARAPHALEYKFATELWRQAMTATVDLAAPVEITGDVLSEMRKSLGAISEFPPATEPLMILRLGALDAFGTPLVTAAKPGAQTAGPMAPPGTAARLEQINARFDALIAALQIADPKQRIARFDQAAKRAAPGFAAQTLADEIGAVSYRRMALVALALAARRHETDGLPASLAELGAVPPDPGSGGAFSYAPKGRQFRLYGVGADGRDDGGHPPADLVVASEEPPRLPAR